MSPIEQIEVRIHASEQDKAVHQLARRHIEAAACEIRIQAFREAVAILRGRALPPNQFFQKMGRRSAEEN